MSTSAFTQIDQSGQTGLSQPVGSKDACKTVLIPSLLLLACLCAIVPAAAGWLMVVCFAAALLIASWIDTRTRLIPNRLTYPLFIFGISGNLIISLLGNDTTAGAVGIQESLTGASICFGLMLLLFVSNATGGGDLKLATAIGAFLGPQAGLMAIAWCHVLAGAFVLAWLLSQLDLLRLTQNLRHYFFACLVAGRIKPVRCDLSSVGQKRIPMAAFFTLGVVMTVLGYRLW